jgi:hypothetical protein
MRSWLGAVAVAVAVGLAGAPAVARADDGVTLTRFQLPNRAAIDTLNTMGADLAENVIDGVGDTVYVDAVVTAQEKAVFQAMGYMPVETLSNDSTVAAVRAERDATIQDEQAARANLRAGHTVTKAQGKSLAADSVEATHADYEAAGVATWRRSSTPASTSTTATCCASATSTTAARCPRPCASPARTAASRRWP